MYNSNTDSLGLILDVEVFFLWVTVQEHCVGLYKPIKCFLSFKSQKTGTMAMDWLLVTGHGKLTALDSIDFDLPTLQCMSLPSH